MTSAEHVAQRDLVTASLAAARHPDFYSRRGVARLANDGRGTARVSVTHVVEAVASQALEGTNAGQDGGPRERAQPGYQPEMCVCGHPVGDHQSGGTSGLHAPAFGLCLVKDCECNQFQTARAIPGTRRVM